MAAKEEIAVDMEEMQLREEQLDFVYIYPEGSEKAADEVIAKLHSAGLKGLKYNEEKPFKSWYLDRKIKMRDDLYKRSTFILFHVDNNLHKDNEMITTKDETIEEAIYHPKQNIIPIWYVSKGKLEQKAFDSLFGLRSINGVNPHSSSFEKTMKDLVEMPQFVKAREEREDKQAKNLEEYQDRAKKLEEDRAKKLEEDRAKKLEEDRLKMEESPKPEAKDIGKVREQIGRLNIQSTRCRQRIMPGKAFWQQFSEMEDTVEDYQSVHLSYPSAQTNIETGNHIYDGGRVNNNEAKPDPEQKAEQPIICHPESYIPTPEPAGFNQREVTPDGTSPTTAQPIRNDTATNYRSNSSNAASSNQEINGVMEPTSFPRGPISKESTLRLVNG